MMSVHYTSRRPFLRATLLALVFLFSSFAATVSTPIYLPTEDVVSYTNEQLYDYEIFVADKNDTAGGDGFLTTMEPTGSQLSLIHI